MQPHQKQNNHQSSLSSAAIMSSRKKDTLSNLATTPGNHSLSRSKLTTATFIKWLRSRFNGSLPKRFPYLYFPHQLTRETSIEQIFVEFDSDLSGGLSRLQVFDMFNGFGISISMNHLDQLYDSVQVNLEELNSQMFKKCALGEKSNKVFREIVRQLQNECVDQQQKKYLPHNFTNMIIYLVYLSKRKELREQIQKDKVSIQDKVQNIENLLKLKDLSLNNERLTLHTQTMKDNLRNKFRDIWEKNNEKHAQKFLLTPKLEQEFYSFCLKKQGIIQPTKSNLTSRQVVQKQPRKYLTKKNI